jgi:hypothetical protein
MQLSRLISIGTIGLCHSTNVVNFDVNVSWRPTEKVGLAEMHLSGAVIEEDDEDKLREFYEHTRVPAGVWVRAQSNSNFPTSSRIFLLRVTRRGKLE